MHRLMIGASAQFPDLAARFHDSGPRGHIDLLADRLRSRAVPGDPEQTAEALFGLLLGEAHRRRLLGLTAAPTPAAARRHALAALALLGLDDRVSTGEGN